MDPIWFDNYQPGVEHHIHPEKYSSLVALFNDTCKQHAHNIAYTHMGVQLTYSDIEKYSRWFAIFLQQHVKPGTHVAIILPNLLQYPIALFGILRAACVVVNTNPLYTVDEWVYQLNDAKVEAVIILSHLTQRFAQASIQLPALKHIIVTDVGDLFPPMQRYLTNAYCKHIKYRTSQHTIQHAIQFRQALVQGQQGQLHQSVIKPYTLALLQYTGGTTGISKGAMLTHRNLVANILQTAAWVAPLKFGKHDCILTALPLYHIFSLTANCLLFFYLGSNNLLITDPRDTNNLIKQLRCSKVTAITGVNTLFNALLNHPQWLKVNTTHLKLTLSGGMPLHANVADRWLKHTHQPLFEAYGLTEASPAVTINPLHKNKYRASIGLPLPSTEITIRNQRGHEMPINEIGELCVRGPQVMQGYWQQPTETQKTFWPDGFLRTGDQAYVDDHGFVYLVGRLKDMILISGFNVYPNEIEHVLQKIPGIAEVAVVGIKLADGDEAIKACVVKRDPKLTEQEILTYAKAHLTQYKIPKIIAFYPELPKTSVGKILRRKLEG